MLSRIMFYRMLAKQDQHMYGPNGFYHCFKCANDVFEIAPDRQETPQQKLATCIRCGESLFSFGTKWWEPIPLSNHEAISLKINPKE